jgi:hypothetical protein
MNVVAGRVSLLENRLQGLEIAMANVISDIRLILSGLSLNREQQQHQPPVSAVPGQLPYHPPPVSHLGLHSQYVSGGTSQPVACAPVLSAPGIDGDFIAQPCVNVLPQSLTSQPVAYAPVPSYPGIAGNFIAQPCVNVLPQSSSDSSPSSPQGVGFAFRCPLCTKPQYTPKSHCGHIRNIVDGTGFCFLRRDVPFHFQILEYFRSPKTFAGWYVQRLRSSMGSAYTEADIQRYNDLQSELSRVLAAGGFYNE